MTPSTTSNGSDSKQNETQSEGAICSLCDQNMKTAEGCTLDKFIKRADGWISRPPKYGEGRDWPDLPERCPDCAVHLGNVHHSGCDIEMCPHCERQLLTCECDTIIEQ